MPDWHVAHLPAWPLLLAAPLPTWQPCAPGALLRLPIAPLTPCLPAPAPGAALPGPAAALPAYPPTAVLSASVTDRPPPVGKKNGRR